MMTLNDVQQMAVRAAVHALVMALPQPKPGGRVKIFTSADKQIEEGGRKVANIAIHETGFCKLPSGVEISMLPVWDREYDDAARLPPAKADRWLKAGGYRLPTPEEYDELEEEGLHIEPLTLPTPEMLARFGFVPRSQAALDWQSREMMTREWCDIHKAAVRVLLEEAAYTGHQPVANYGKHWSKKKSGERGIYGWPTRRPAYYGLQGGRRVIQDFSQRHEPESEVFVDYATTFHAVKLSGAKSTTKPEKPAGSKPTTPSPAGSLARAVSAALRDLNVLSPDRGRASDGTWPSEAHRVQSPNSDHNRGNAVDLTHDPVHADCHILSELAITDPRAEEVIWNGRIWSVLHPEWRAYEGTNPHDHHMHVSVRPELRDDASCWPWAPPGLAEIITPEGQRTALEVLGYAGDLEKATRAFQKASGLTVDGDFGSKTMRAMLDAFGASPKA